MPTGPHIQIILAQWLLNKANAPLARAAGRSIWNEKKSGGQQPAVKRVDKIRRGVKGIFMA